MAMSDLEDLLYIENPNQDIEVEPGKVLKVRIIN